MYLLGRGRRSGLAAGAVAWVEGGREARLGERFSGPTLTERPPIGKMEAQNYVMPVYTRCNVTSFNLKVTKFTCSLCA